MIIKVCGMRDLENINSVSQLTIDWIGFIFFPQSKRYMHYNQADTIYKIIQCPQKKAGVFVNSETNEIEQTATTFKLDLLQLHGNETVSQCGKLKDNHFQIIKAFSIDTTQDLKRVYAYEGVVDYFLFDTKCEGYGGSGKQFDWSVLEAYQGNTPFLLSGGISLASIPDLIQFKHPLWKGIDLNSGFEIAPALKDIDKLKHFIILLKENNIII